MEKTSVYLSDPQRRRLRRLSKLTGKSQATIIREAIAQYEPERPPDRNFAVSGVGHGPGGSIEDVSEDELLEGFGE